MKKIFLPIFLFCLVLLFFVPFSIKSVEDPACGSTGIVRCGCSTPTYDADEKCTNCCEISDFFAMLGRIYEFIVKIIAIPLAIIAITIGGILMMISAGNPNMMSLGKKIFYSAIIGLVLVFCSYLIIQTILSILDYKNLTNWSNLSI